MSGYLSHCLIPAVTTEPGKLWTPESSIKIGSMPLFGAEVDGVEKLLKERTIALINNNSSVLRSQASILVSLALQFLNYFLV